MKFRQSKYVDPDELTQFSSQLKDAIKALQGTRSVQASKRKPGKTGLELWPLVHHIAMGKYFTYASKNGTPAEFWIGLDLAEETVGLMIWFDEPDQSTINNLIQTQGKVYYDSFGRYKSSKIDQFWITLKDTEFDRFYDSTSPQQSIDTIKNFLDEVLGAIP